MRFVDCRIWFTVAIHILPDALVVAGIFCNNVQGSGAI